MLRRVAWLMLFASVGSRAEAQGTTPSLVGTWTLVSRTDSGAAGVLPADGALGSDPIAMLMYDKGGNVTAQLMARRRSSALAVSTPMEPPDPNNSAASGSYDAYFGRYTVDSAARTVTHELVAALAPADVGRRLTRHFEFTGDSLRLWFETRREDGQPVRRRLLWLRTKTE